MDSVEANAAFARKYQFPYPLLSDTGGRICRAYDACAEAGEIRRNTVIVAPDGEIRRIFADVKPEGHVETVLTFLEAASRIVSSTRDPRPQINLLDGQCPPQKGAQEKMDDQQPVDNGTVRQVTPPNRLGKAPEILREGESESVATAALATVAPSGVAAAAASPSQPLPTGRPSRVLPAQASDGPSLVFALGTLGYDFGAEARRDSIAQHMEGSPYDPNRLLSYLEANPWDASSIFWTLNLDATPIYAIYPQGAFAEETYDRLRRFLREQLTEGVERVSVPGIITGQVALMSGQVVPTIHPNLRCMYSWTTSTLAQAVVGKAPANSAKDEEREAYTQTTEAVSNFLERVYHELRNLGIAPHERAINFAATNALNVERIFETALREAMQLDTIEVERSPICRPDSECWEVKLTFFNPSRQLEQARRVYRFTVDVSDVCPVIVGKVRSWYVR